MIERLVVERVVVARLGLAWADLMYDAFPVDLEFRDVAAHVTQMRNAANRNHLN